MWFRVVGRESGFIPRGCFINNGELTFPMCFFLKEDFSVVEVVDD